MMVARHTWLTSAILLLLVTVSVAAQGIHTLQGKVITPGGSQPQNPVKVTLTFGGRRIYETFTDLSGHFSFSGVGKGTYQLTAEGDDVNFESTIVYAEVSAFGSAPQLFTQDIHLQPVRGKPTSRPAVVNAFTQDVPRQAQQAFVRAQKLEEEGKREEALAEIQEAIRIFPPYFEARLSLGNHYLKAARFNEAIAELDRAREINPNDERLYQSFGLILLRQKNYPVAMAVFAEASRLNPSNPVNHLMRATALIYQASVLATSATQSASDDRKQLLTKAEQALSQANELSDGKVKADHLTLSMFYELKGDPGRAAAELEGYLRKSPGAVNAAQIRQEIKRLREAAAHPRP